MPAKELKGGGEEEFEMSLQVQATVRMRKPARSGPGCTVCVSEGRWRDVPM